MFEGRPWMEKAFAWGGTPYSKMETGKVYLHEPFTTVFVRFGCKPAAKAFVAWAEENIDYWGVDPVALIDTGDPEEAAKWKDFIVPPYDYRTSKLHNYLKEQYKLNPMKMSGNRSGNLFLVSEAEMNGGIANYGEGPGIWWVCSPVPAREKRPSIIVEVEDGRVCEVYSTDPELDVEILDLDTTDAEQADELMAQHQELLERFEKGELHSLL